MLTLSAGCGFPCWLPFSAALPGCHDDIECETDADCADGGLCDASGACVACLVDGDCDDGDSCTADSCDAGGDCSSDVVVCASDLVCDPADGACVGCAAEADCAAELICDPDSRSCESPCAGDAACDDGAFCNGAETCDADSGLCVSPGDPCEGSAEPVCDESQGACVECADQNDCDEGEACVEGTCVLSCASGDDCNDALPRCEPDRGVCVACVEDADCQTEDPCGACDMEANACAVVITCDSDANCDDGLFCNGVEACGDCFCEEGTSPCPDDQACDEAVEECVAPIIDPIIRDLTPGIDTITLLSGDEFFDGSRVLESGVFIVTVNDGDVLDGGAGTDTLIAQITDDVTPQLLAGIEIFHIELIGGGDATFGLVNADAATTIHNNNPTGRLTVSGVTTSPTAFGMTNGSVNFTVSIDAAALSGTEDEATITLSNVSDGGNGEPVIQFGPDSAGSGYETFTIHSTGDVDNSIDDLSDGLGTSLTTLNVTGDRGLTIRDVLLSTITTVNALDATGAVDVSMPIGTTSFVGGTGDDVIRYGGHFDASDTISGGGGSDTLESDADDLIGTTAILANVTGVDIIRATTLISGNLNLVHYGVTQAIFAGKDDTARTVTLATGGTIEVTDDLGANDLDIVLSGADTTEDAFTLRLNGGVRGADFAGDIDAASFEQMTLMCDGTHVDNYDLRGITLNSAAGVVETITITGTQNLDVNGVITAGKIVATEFTGVFDNSAGTVAGAVIIMSGSGSDLIDGSSTTDVIDGGPGDDRIEGKSGSDQLTGGTGSDIFDMDGIVAADTDRITDFEAGTSTSSMDSIVLDLSSIEAFAAVTEMTNTSAALTIAGQTVIYVAQAADGTTISNADIVGIVGDHGSATEALANRTNWTITFGSTMTDGHAFLIAYTSGTSVRIAVAVVDNDGDDATANTTSDVVDYITDILILENVSLSNLDSGDFGAIEG